MKKTLLLLSFCIFIFCNLNSLKAQNIIPNGNFELGPDTFSAGWKNLQDSCIIVGLVHGPDYWTVVKGSPDRFVNNDIPKCNWDTDSAIFGNAYINVGGFWWGGPEEGKATLLSPLQKDTIYYLSYWVKTQTYRDQFLPAHPDRIGFFFNGSDTLISPNIMDTLEWEMHDTIFVADTNSTEIFIMGYGDSGVEKYTALKVDNITLKKMSEIAINDLTIEKILNVYPIPASNILYIKSFKKIDNIKIFNVIGKETNSYEIKNYNVPLQVDISQLSEGIYFLQVSIMDKLYNKKIMILN